MNCFSCLLTGPWRRRATLHTWWFCRVHDPGLELKDFARTLMILMLWSDEAMDEFGNLCGEGGARGRLSSKAC